MRTVSSRNRQSAPSRLPPKSQVVDGPMPMIYGRGSAGRYDSYVSQAATLQVSTGTSEDNYMTVVDSDEKELNRIRVAIRTYGMKVTPPRVFNTAIREQDGQNNLIMYVWRRS